ncbi:sulfurtransferase FdhD [Desulfococcus multivorans]|nr:sulfurtransferase FdhD [Desulfococcus multivorans]
MVRCKSGNTLIAETQMLISEEPLSIRVENTPYAVVMRTPGDERFLAAGFCLAEGLVDRVEDFAAIGYCEQMDPNVIAVTLTPQRREKVSDLLARRGYISQTSCGICGKELVKDLIQNMVPSTDTTRIDLAALLERINDDRMQDYQDLYRKTNSAHGAVLFSRDLAVMGLGEDVGRHNALDKAIGQALLENRLPQTVAAVLSSRVSYELVQKCARAGIGTIVSMSRPTALAVDLGGRMNMTLACISKEGDLLIFSGRERLVESG